MNEQLKKTSRKGALLAALGLALFWLYALVIYFFTVTETCTMGGEGLFPDFIVGIPFGLASFVCLLRSRYATGWRLWLQTGIILPAILLMLMILLPQVISVSIFGHHSCGPEFDYLLNQVPEFERWLPIGHFILVSAVLWYTITAFFSRSVS